MIKSHLIRDILLVSAGIATGVVTTVGGVVGGTALFALSINGRGVENATKLDLFGEDFQDKNLLQMITAISNGEVDFNTLAGIEKLTPQVNTIYNYLDEFLAQYGVKFDKEELYNLKFEEYPSYMENKITSSIYLASFVGVNESSPEIMKYFFLPMLEDGSGYDFEHPYSVKDFTSENFMNDKLNNLPLHIIYQGEDTPALMEYMFYPMIQEGDTYRYDYEHPYTYQQYSSDGFMDGLINNLKIGYIYGDDTHGVMDALKDLTIAGLNDPDVIGGLHVSDFFEGELSGMAAAFADFTISDFNDQSKIDEMIVGKLLGDQETTIKTTYDEFDEPLITYLRTDVTSDEEFYIFTAVFSDGEGELPYEYKKPLADGDTPYEVYLAEDGTYYLYKGNNESENTMFKTISKYKVSTIRNNPNKLMEQVKISDLYGTIDESHKSDNPIMYAIQDLTLDQLNKTHDDGHGSQIGYLNEKVFGLTVGEIASIDPNDKIMTAIADLSINELTDGHTAKDTIFGMPLIDFLGESYDPATANPIIKTLCERVDGEGNPTVMVGDLLEEDTISDLTLEEILGTQACNDSTILNALRENTLTDLKDPDTIDSLTIEDLLGKEACNTSTILNAIRGYSLEQLKDGSTLDAMTIGEILGNKRLDGVPANATYVETSAAIPLADGTGDEYRVTFSVPGEEDIVVSYVVYYEGEETTTTPKEIFKNNGIWFAKFNLENDSKVLTSIQGYTINELQHGAIENLALSNFLPSGTENAVLLAVQDLSLNQLSNESLINERISNLKISELLPSIDDDSFLSLIKDYKVSELTSGNKLENELYIGAILGNKDTGIASTATLINTTKVTIIDEDSGDPIGERYTLTFDVGGDEETYSYDVMFEPGESTTEAKELYECGGTYWVRLAPETKLNKIIATWTINDFKDGTKFNNILVSDLIDTPSGTSPIIDSLSGITLGELNEAKVREAMGSVPVSQFVTTPTSNPIINALLTDEHGDDVTVDGLQARMEALTLDDVFPGRSGILANIDGDTPISEIDQAINETPMLTLFQDEAFTSNDPETKELKTTWKFLLTPGDEDVTPIGVAYKNDPNKSLYENYTMGDGLEELLDNFTQHSQNEKLEFLADMGLLGDPDSSTVQTFLEKEIGTIGLGALTYAGKGAGKTATTKFKELTLNELVIVISSINLNV